MGGGLRVLSLQWQQRTNTTSTSRRQCILLLNTHSDIYTVLRELHYNLERWANEVVRLSRVMSSQEQEEMSMLCAYKLSKIACVTTVMIKQARMSLKKYLTMYNIYHYFLLFHSNLRHHQYIPTTVHFFKSNGNKLSGECIIQLLLVGFMETNYSFSGMTLTQIFQIQPLQSLFIKFWYLGLTSQQIVSIEDTNIFKAIRKNISFANCFTFEMPIRSYINFIDKILQALSSIDPKKTFEILLGHLRNNKVISVSFELFGVAFLQLFGRILELLNTQMMNKILRKIFYQITVISKMGVSTLRVKGIRPISFEQLIPNFNDLLEEKANGNQMGSNLKLNSPEQVSIHHNRQSATEREYDMKTIKGRLQAQRDHNYQLRESVGEHYPIGQKIRNKEKASISCYMMGGFEIVDYSGSINQLHKKLLTKILLNK